ncbi:hypothetical protein C476_16615 [Natrinema limicola JCM 13563]|uniref:Uncharacterized protein n=1 Tax=Natrinema limicola JCM 13563 TaxID=1230457 RepID=M0C2T2_9EURY|nr:hypothetical protein C476_16615 [Natrinema limicola JCM 13563]
MEPDSVPPVSAVILCVQLFKEPAGGRPDPNAVDVAHFKAVRGGPARLVVDEDAVDDCADGLDPVGIDDGCRRRIEMCVLVIGLRVLRPFHHEVDHVVD